MGKSTGPRTPRGKARSSQNAARHWIEAGRILPGEQQEAAILRNGFTEDFKPQGLIEHDVIDDLTLNRLIKRRIDLAFSREFSKAGIEKTVKMLDIGERSATQYWLRSAEVRGTNRGEREQAERLRPDLCIAALESLKVVIGDRGPQRQDLAEIRQIFGDQPTENAALAMYLLVPFAEKQNVQDEKAGSTSEDELKKEILGVLDTEIKLQKVRARLAGEVSAIESAAYLQEPPRPTLDTLLRYSSANMREFRELLDNLERIRRLRRGAA
jgi:hypothetical protein